MKPAQFEFPAASECFNLSGQVADDPWRLDRERWAAARAAEANAAFQARCQLTLAQCPGVVGFDAPSSEVATGKVVIEPAKVLEAYAWLRRRFHVSENLGLSTDQGLCVEIKPRTKRSTPGRRSGKVHFKIEQFDLPLFGSDKSTT